MVSEEEVKLVLARLDSMPQNMKLSIGKYGSFSKLQLIKQVEEKTEVGELVINMYMNYLRSFKDEVK